MSDAAGAALDASSAYSVGKDSWDLAAILAAQERGAAVHAAGLSCSGGSGGSGGYGKCRAPPLFEFSFEQEQEQKRLCTVCDGWTSRAVLACRDCSETQCEECLSGSQGFCTSCTIEFTINSQFLLARLRKSLDERTLVAPSSFVWGCNRIGVGEKLKSVRGRAVESMADVPKVHACKMPMRFVFAVPMG